MGASTARVSNVLIRELKVENVVALIVTWWASGILRRMKSECDTRGRGGGSEQATFLEADIHRRGLASRAISRVAA